MKRQTVIIFYILGIYVFLQFAWWGYHLIELTFELNKAPSETAKRTIMVLGEGLVFFSILILGLWKIRSSIRKELQLTKNQNNFLLSVTHELKTPIASTRLLLQTLKKHGLNEDKRKDLLDKTLSENLRLESLIDNILNATRLEHNALLPTYEDTNLSLVMNEIATTYENRFPKATLTRQLESDTPVRCDRLFIECILTNLLDNAFKYAGEEAHVTLQLQGANTHVKITVSDNGLGIPDLEKKEIFRKFYRSGNEETRSQKGSGLGLYIVSELVRLHQGTIVLSSGKSGGAKFQVILPV
jgi:signal transduction histidine kinase